MDAKRAPLTEDETLLLEETLHHWRKKRVSWLMDTFGDIRYVIERLRAASHHGRLIKFYDEQGTFSGILLFDIGTVWWTPERVCAEEFVLAVQGARGIQRAAVQTLEALAEEHAAKLIVCGNIFQENNNLIGNGYKKAGFRQACATYAKEVKET